MNQNLKKIARAGIGALIFALVLGLALVQPAKADVKETLADFLASCNPDNLDNPDGGRIIHSGEEVEIEDGPEDETVAKCTVKLPPDTELDFGKNLTINVTLDFIIISSGSTSEGEREVEFGENTTIEAGKIEWKLEGGESEFKFKKNSEIISTIGDIKMEVFSSGEDADDAQIEFEENIQMNAMNGEIFLFAKSSGDDAEDAQIKFKKVSDEALLDDDKEFADEPNITAEFGIFIKTESDDEAQITIEESNFLRAINGVIELLAIGGGSGESEVETKKFVQLDASFNNKDITLKVEGSGESELTVDENNVFLAGTGTITIDAGGGELEIKKDSNLDATTIVLKGASGKCESPVMFSVTPDVSGLGFNDGC